MAAVSQIEEIGSAPRAQESLVGPSSSYPAAAIRLRPSIALESHIPHQILSHASLPLERPAMLPTLAVASRSAWKGPFFVALPNLAAALRDNTPIRTNARSCTILPNYVG